jgi:hypothetical protein
VNTQLRTVGELELHRMPPPRVLPLAPVSVKPSITVPGPSPLTHDTTGPLAPFTSMVVTPAPSELRSVTALP